MDILCYRVTVNQLSVVANVLMTSGLMKLISECEADMPGIRQQAYMVAGQLVSKVPSLVKNDLSLLQTLFTVLSQVRITFLLFMFNSLNFSRKIISRSYYFIMSNLESSKL